MFAFCCSFCLAITELTRKRAENELKLKEAERDVELLKEDIRRAILRSTNHKRCFTAKAPLAKKEKKYLFWSLLENTKGRAQSTLVIVNQHSPGLGNHVTAHENALHANVD